MIEFLLVPFRPSKNETTSVFISCRPPSSAIYFHNISISFDRHHLPPTVSAAFVFSLFLHGRCLSSFFFLNSPSTIRLSSSTRVQTLFLIHGLAQTKGLRLFSLSQLPPFWFLFASEREQCSLFWEKTPARGSLLYRAADVLIGWRLVLHPHWRSLISGPFQGSGVDSRQGKSRANRSPGSRQNSSSIQCS